MAKRRTLKKAINTIASELIVECIGVQHNNPSIAKADLENIAKSIILMREDFVARLSHVDKHQVKRFFTQLTDDLTVSTNEIVDAIYHLT